MDQNGEEQQSSAIDTTNEDCNEAQCKIVENGSHVTSSEAVGQVDKVSADSSSLTPPLSPDGKRQKASPSITASTSAPNSPSPSPPKFVTLEEIMKAANGVSNMFLAHEIAVNENFSLQKPETENPVKKQVETIMKKAFWDVLQSQLNETPVNFKQALSLLEEIKGILLSFLLPQHTRLKQEIEEILDLDLIKQQAENGALDFQRYAQYVLSVMARLCAPVRDEKIRELTQTTEVVPLFRGIMELLDVMKLDLANFAIKQVRPHILMHSVKYEQEKFKEFVETNSKLGNKDALEVTKRWLRQNFDNLDLTVETSLKSKIDKTLTASYIEVLFLSDESKLNPFPETLLMDESRIRAVRLAARQIVYIGSVLLVTFATLGPSFQELSAFKEDLKKHLNIILRMESEEDDLKAKFESAAEIVVQDIKNYAEKCNLPQIEVGKQSLLKSQIVEICDDENRVRSVIENRVKEFIENIITSNSAQPVKLPTGLSSLQQELTMTAGQFTRIVVHNKAVFGEYYTKIIEEFAKAV
ncbi:T-complex protein 11-like protein 1 [Leptotrombidium deliense]|uniref:T-complex protein 11-like protein 1 n=1 Tax=Leptotrombidium deliense TaxID=299467 RepID=A0A443STB3_9ACAR|nr:T-complex protein 11-like protein 1 [Leptotrombidium deliense]